MTDDLERDEGHELVVGEGAGARAIAYRLRRGNEPTIVWLGGYRSDMRGTKAEHLLSFAAAREHGFLRLDYSGHGESGGRFEDGTVSRWTEEAKAVIETAPGASVVLAGSSMGAWIALRLTALSRTSSFSKRIAALMLLAPAPDFTERLMKPKLSPEDLDRLKVAGFIEEPSEYSEEPNIYTAALFEDGARNLVMTDTIETGCPVAIVQGMEDRDVPHAHAMELFERIPHDDTTMTLVRDGDHRLSRPKDLELIARVLDGLLAAV